jgi:hypothetical protein
MRRPKEHLCPGAASSKTWRGHWLRQLRSRGVAPLIVVLELLESKEALIEAERWWICYGRLSRWPLTNATDGGEGAWGRKHTEEAKAKIGAASVGRRPSAKSRERMREAHSTRAAKSLETRRKLSAALKGRKRTQEQRARQSATAQGKTASDETRAKMSASHEAAWAEGKYANRSKPDDKARANMSAAQKGRKHTLETKAKMRAAALARQSKLRVVGR